MVSTVSQMSDLGLKADLFRTESQMKDIVPTYTPVWGISLHFTHCLVEWQLLISFVIQVGTFSHLNRIPFSIFIAYSCLNEIIIMCVGGWGDNSAYSLCFQKGGLFTELYHGDLQRKSFLECFKNMTDNNSSFINDCSLFIKLNVFIFQL